MYFYQHLLVLMSTFATVFFDQSKMVFSWPINSFEKISFDRLMVQPHHFNPNGLNRTDQSDAYPSKIN